MQKTLKLGKSGSQLNVPQITGLTASDLGSEPIDESYIFAHFSVNGDPFSGTENLEIRCLYGSGNNDYFSKTVSDEPVDTLNLPHITSNVSEFPEGGTSGPTSNTGFVGSLTSGLVADMMKIANIDNVTEKKYEVINGDFVSDLVGNINYWDGGVEDVINPTPGDFEYVLALPFFSDSSPYSYSDILLDFSNPSITDLTFLGLKKVTRKRTCTVGGFTYSWIIEEYVISETPCA